MTARLLSIGIAAPNARLGTERAIALASALSAPGVRRETIAALHRRSGIDERGCVIFDSAGRQELYGADPNELGPTTAERLTHYAPRATELAATASREAIDRAGIAAGRVTHLVTVSCTGFEAPGFDQALMRCLGLRSTVRRTHIGFMGCHAAINGLAAACAFASADADAVVLVCCVELCSLHYHFGGRMDQLVANALFADGAAAAVVAQRAPEGAPMLSGFASTIFEGSEAEMSWKIGDHGFEMTLAPTIPETLRRVVPEWVGALLDSHGLVREEVGGWAVHPGGPRIVRAVIEALQLGADHGGPSLGVLRSHGNMSSPTVLFILRALWDAGVSRPWVGLAFGPGVAGEAVVIR